MKIVIDVDVANERGRLAKSLARIESALENLEPGRAQSGAAPIGLHAGTPGTFWKRFRQTHMGRNLPLILLMSGLMEYQFVRMGHPVFGVLIFIGIIGQSILRNGLLLPADPAAQQTLDLMPARPHIGLGATIGDGAIVEPGATVEVGASVGAGAVIQRGAVVRMGASIGARAVVENDAIVSWGADVRRDAVVGAHARVGAGATVKSGAHVPRDLRIFPGGEWGGKAARDVVAGDDAGDTRFSKSRATDVASARTATPLAAPSAASTDPRAVKFSELFARIDAQIDLAPALVREHLGASAGGVRALRGTCTALLAREHALRTEASPEAVAQLLAERDGINGRIATSDDAQTRMSLQSAIAAIDTQVQQRKLLARSADRLDAELTRLFWTLDGLVAQLVRLRSAGADATQAPDARLSQSVQQLQSEVAAIADALEEVSRGVATAGDAQVPTENIAAESAVAPPGQAAASSTQSALRVRADE